MGSLIAFRADASVAMGTGHVVRCTTLAGALRAQGAKLVFLCRQLPAGLRETLGGEGITVTMLPSVGPFDAAADAAQTIAALRPFGRPDWLVADHYALGASWERSLRPHVERIMVIDDLADRAHDCDLLLDQNYYANAEERYRALVPSGCRLLLGPRNALLRLQFEQARKSRRWRDGAPSRLMICFGGSDPENLTERAIGAFLAAGLENMTADVVIGAANPHGPALVAGRESMSNLRFHREVRDMAALMAEADLFLGAGGSMTWERSALGLAGLTIAVAANQEQLCEEIEAVGGGIHLGDPTMATEVSIVAALRLACRHPRLLRAFGERLAALTDGRGAVRLARLLVPLPINLRLATDEDCDRLYSWRNAPETRRHSGAGEPISYAGHRAWLAATLDNPDCVLLVGERLAEDGNAVPVGVLRYDLAGNQATISVYLVPGCEGSGLGKRLIEVGDDWLRANRPGIAEIHARINPENVASLGAFRAAGYGPEASLFGKKL